MMKKNEVVPGTKPKKKGKVCIALGVVAVVAVVAISSAFKNLSAQVEMVSNTIEIEPVQYRDLSESISLNGTISGESQTNVMSVASAEVTAVNVQVGDIVEEGTPLITLDTTELEKQAADLKKDIANAGAIAQNDNSQLNQSLSEAQEDQSKALSRLQDSINDAQSEYDGLKADIAKTEAEIKEKEERLSKAKKELAGLEKDSDKYKKLLEECTTLETSIAGHEARLETYKASVEAAEAALETAKENYEDTLTSTNRSVAAAQNTVDMSAYQSDSRDDLNSQLENVQKQLADCSLSAPCGGVVTAVNVSVGDNYVGGQTMVTIENTNKMKVIVTVDEADILKIEEGMKAIVTTEATGDEEIAGTITRVVRVKNQSVNVSEVNTSSGYSAEIAIDDTKLLVGMTAKAKIVLKEKADVLAVPYDLIQTDENGKTFVLVAEAQSDGSAKAVRRDITIGEEVGYYTEVTGGDLKEGEQLIYDYTYSVTEGQIFAPEQMYSEQDLGFANDATVEAE